MAICRVRLQTFAGFLRTLSNAEHQLGAGGLRSTAGRLGCCVWPWGDALNLHGCERGILAVSSLQNDRSDHNCCCEDAPYLSADTPPVGGHPRLFIGLTVIVHTVYCMIKYHESNDRPSQ